MTLFDIAILVALGFAIMHGLKEGFVARAATVLGFAAALVVVRNYYDVLEETVIGLPEKSYLTAIIAVLVLAAIFGYVLRLMDKTLDFAKIIPGIGSMNKIGGAILGFAEALIVMSLLTYGAYVLWTQETVEIWLADSALGNLLTHATNFVIPIINYMLDIV